MQRPEQAGTASTGNRRGRRAREQPAIVTATAGRRRITRATLCSRRMGGPGDDAVRRGVLASLCGVPPRGGKFLGASRPWATGAGSRRSQAADDAADLNPPFGRSPRSETSLRLPPCREHEEQDMRQHWGLTKRL